MDERLDAVIRSALLKLALQQCENGGLGCQQLIDSDGSLQAEALEADLLRDALLLIML